MKGFFKIFIILLAITFIIGFVVYLVKFGVSSGSETGGTTIQGPAQIAVDEQGQPMFSYTGVIKEIGENFIKIQAEPSKNFALEETLIVKVDIDKNTDFIKVIFPSQLPALEEGEGQSILNRQEIGFRDLEIGQVVMAISLENIKDKQEFLASKIEAIGDR